ncbi:hypothetical protein PGT21_009243 [Puccinia graminis f. sp. tritici]|uniref:Uncharacterized protein n=1 Tax=Puccinia graminis f. sp. tritici TaxID=56615 RepID=A0A5B0LTX9_PUCGR|nr:hypothetical protein PGT21_009243 [Puccinia graminis f. sp. tritici]
MAEKFYSAVEGYTLDGREVSTAEKFPSAVEVYTLHRREKLLAVEAKLEDIGAREIVTGLIKIDEKTTADEIAKYSLLDRKGYSKIVQNLDATNPALLSIISLISNTSMLDLFAQKTTSVLNSPLRQPSLASVSISPQTRLRSDLSLLHSSLCSPLAPVSSRFSLNASLICLRSDHLASFSPH